MSEHRPLPPDGAEYWEQLAGRIERAAAERGAPMALAWLGGRAARLVGVGVVAAALLGVWVAVSSNAAAGREDVVATRWVRALTPSDSLGRALAVEQPPSIGGLILAGTRQSERARERRR